MNHETYLRAVELDDDLPLDVCPGCGRDLTEMAPGQNHMTPEQWANHVKRYRFGTGKWRDSFVVKAPFCAPMQSGARCVWTGEMLLARKLRREWRHAYEAVHA